MAGALFDLRTAPGGGRAGDSRNAASHAASVVTSAGGTLPALTGTVISTASAALAAARTARLVRMCAAFAGLSVLVCAAMLTALHLMPPADRLDPVSQPLSRYALTPDGVVFDLAVGLLAVGLLALLLGLRLGRRAGRPASVALVTCITGLVLLVIFPDVVTPAGLTVVGRIHWVASMVAFGVIPVVPLSLWTRRRGVGGSVRSCRLTRAGRRIGILAVVWFAVLAIGNVLALLTGIPLWRVGGVVERALALTELAAAGIAAAWMWRGCRCAREFRHSPRRQGR